MGKLIGNMSEDALNCPNPTVPCVPCKSRRGLLFALRHIYIEVELQSAFPGLEGESSFESDDDGTDAEAFLH